MDTSARWWWNRIIEPLPTPSELPPTLGTNALHFLLAMPWQGANSTPLSWGLALSIALVAAALAAWMVRAIPSPRSWVLVAVAVTLCFTGSAAVALHDVAFDPLTPAFAILLGSLGGWFMSRKPASEAIADQAVENRPVFVLTVGLVEAAALRARLGPNAFLTLAAAFRKRAASLLQARQALVLPGSGDSLQACFGVPHASANDAENAAQTSILLARALAEFFRQQSSPPPSCSIALKHGTATTGVVDGTYEVVGEVLEECRHLWERAASGFVITDEATAEKLPESLHGVDIGNGLWRLIEDEESVLPEMAKIETFPATPDVAVDPPAPLTEPALQAEEIPVIANVELPPVVELPKPPEAKKKIEAEISKPNAKSASPAKAATKKAKRRK